MEDTYYFSQGRMTYNKFKEPPRDIETGLMAIDATAANATKTASGTSSGTSNFLSKLWNFQLYNKSILRYKL